MQVLQSGCEASDSSPRPGLMVAELGFPSLKTDDGEKVLEDAACKLKVCGHPMRLKLLCLISRGEDTCVSELWVCLNQPQPVISQHLAVLKDKGIVKSEVQGNKRIYTIVDPFILALVQALDPSRLET